MDRARAPVPCSSSDSDDEAATTLERNRHRAQTVPEFLEENHDGLYSLWLAVNEWSAANGYPFFSQWGFSDWEEHVALATLPSFRYRTSGFT